MVTTRVEALVVRSDREGEADRLLTLYTRELGRVTALARGADRPRNRWAGRTRLFALIRGDLYQKRRGAGRYSLTQSQLLRAHEGIQAALERIGAAAEVCEMVAALTPAGVAQPALWELLLECMDALDRGKGKESAVSVFQARFLEIMGLAPHLGGCTVCGREYGGRSAAYYAAAKGGLVCRACQDQVDVAELVSRGAMAVLLDLGRMPFGEAIGVTAKSKVWEQVRKVLAAHLEYHLDFQSRTAGWLREG